VALAPFPPKSATVSRVVTALREEGTRPMSVRLTARIVPPHPITVGIEDEDSGPLAYGVIADISGTGACVWTDAQLDLDATLVFRISFACPPEVHEVTGVVVWGQDCLEGAPGNARRYGIEWRGACCACRDRLGQLAARAVEPADAGRYPFERRWTVEKV